jgi:uncharacterized membrane protein YkgB
MPNSKPRRNAKYLSNSQLSQPFIRKNHPLDSTKTHYNYESNGAFHRSKAMGLILLLIVLVLLFGGGGFYAGPPYHYYGGGLSLIVVIVILVILFRR